MEIFNCGRFSIARFSVSQSDGNYSYVVSCAQTGGCAVIDPLSPEEIIDHIAQAGLSAQIIVNTHSHPDHTAGNARTAKATGAEIVSHPLGKEKTGASKTVNEGDSAAFGNQTFSVMHTPGHCPDHISLLIDGNVFVADTLFLAGCGNTRFGGNAGDLFKSVARLGELDGKTRVFCGHNYAEKNLEFALSVEPENTHIKEKLNEIRSSENPISTIGEELLYNPFMRVGSPEIAKRVAEVFPDTKSDADVFAGLRELRDRW